MTALLSHNRGEAGSTLKQVFLRDKRWKREAGLKCTVWGEGGVFVGVGVFVRVGLPWVVGGSGGRISWSG